MINKCNTSSKKNIMKTNSEIKIKKKIEAKSNEIEKDITDVNFNEEKFIDKLKNNVSIEFELKDNIAFKKIENVNKKKTKKQVKPFAGIKSKKETINSQNKNEELEVKIDKNICIEKKEKGTIEKPKYNIEYLINIQNSPYVKNYSDSNVLPQKSFWRNSHKMNNKQKNFSNKQFQQELSGVKTAHTKKTNLNNKKNGSKPWPKNTSFNNNKEYDDVCLPPLKFSSHFSNENHQEEIPEWDSFKINSDQQIDMTQSVEKFERWKQKMKMKELRKNGEMLDVEDLLCLKNDKISNEVDNFFFFLKSKPSQFQDPGIGRLDLNAYENSLDHKLDNKQSDELLNKGSRFSFFFDAITNNKNENPIVTEFDQEQQNENPFNYSCYNKIEGIKNNQVTPYDLIPPEMSISSPQKININDSIALNPKITELNKNDAFFMSLMNKNSHHSNDIPNNTAVSKDNSFQQSNLNQFYSEKFLTNDQSEQSNMFNNLKFGYNDPNMFQNYQQLNNDMFNSQSNPFEYTFNTPKNYMDLSEENNCQPSNYNNIQVPQFQNNPLTQGTQWENITNIHNHENINQYPKLVEQDKFYPSSFDNTQQIHNFNMNRHFFSPIIMNHQSNIHPDIILNQKKHFD